MYIMCICLFSALSRRVGALQISIIIISSKVRQIQNKFSGERELQNHINE